jgi:hypothetical protein
MPRSLLLKRGLRFPGYLRPGFDKAHPCAGGTWLSAIPVTTNNFIDLLTGMQGAANTAFPIGGTKVRAYIGPAAGLDNSTGNQGVTFGAGGSLVTPVTPYPATLAAIFTATALVNGNQTPIANGSGGNIQLGIYSNTFQINRWNASNDNTSFTPTAGVPYFLACTTDNVATTVIVWTRLDTGKIQYYTATPASGISATTFEAVIGYTSGGNPMDGFVGPVMISTAVNTLGNMLRWAADPWSFWYPNGQAVAFDADLVSKVASAPAGGPAPSLTTLGVGP